MRTSLKRRNAFTLIELLVVVTIIAILAALVLGVSGYATQKADRARAIADLEKIKTALESYRATYGRYPISSSSGSSVQWLTNLWVKPIDDGYPPFITAKFLTNENTVSAFLDPWGNDYRYLHRVSAPYADFNNSKFGYDLWSQGPKTGDDSDDITNWRGDIQ